jgi:hypothetical protein
MNCIPDIVLPKDCSIEEATEIARSYLSTAGKPNGWRKANNGRKINAIRDFLFEMGLIIISDENGVQHIVSVENPL